MRVTYLTYFRNALVFVLSVVLAFSFVPATALAADTDETSATVLDTESIETDIAESVDEESGLIGDEEADLAIAEHVAEALLAQSYALVPLADDSGTITCDNGWVLDYTVTDDEATIIGVSQAGSTGELVVPDSINGVPVTAIGDAAFRASADDTSSPTSAITSAVLPASIAGIGLQAFSGSNIESVNIPAAVPRLPYRCFFGCKSLTTVNFEGGSMRYLGDGVFAYCSAMTKIEIPLLTDTPTYDDMEADGLNDGSVSFGSSIGRACFQSCTSLNCIVFGGPVVSNPTKYFYNTSCLSDCGSNLILVCKGAAVDVPMGTGGSAVLTARTVYYTLDFYESEELAATESYDNQIGSVTCAGTALGTSSSGNRTEQELVRIFDLLYGRVDYSDSIYSGSVPECPEGKVWGVIGLSNPNNHSFMSGSYKVVAVDPNNMNYGWVSSPSIESVNASTTGTSSMGGYNNDDDTTASVTFYVQADGSIPELYEIAAYISNGTQHDESDYTIVFQKATIVTERGNNGMTHQTIQSWNNIAVEDISQTGLYRVYAQGTGDYANTQTNSVSFNIVRPTPTVSTYYDSSNMMSYLGNVAYDAACSLIYGAPSYSVIVPSSDWRNQLLGAGFAGASSGTGLLLTDCGTDANGDLIFSNQMVQAFNQAVTYSSERRYLIIGNEQDVPLSNNIHDYAYFSDYIAVKCTSGSRYGSGITTAQELATSAIGTFRPDRWGTAAWGDTAVVASPNDELITEAAAEYVYNNACRVFYLTDDGTIAASDLTSLAADDITDIVLIGDSSCVSDAVASEIASATGKTPSRILENSTATLGSIELAQQMVADKNTSWSTVVIADSTESANVSNAAVLASSLGGVMLTCRSTTDAKAIEAFFETLILTVGLDAVSDIRLVGEFSYLADEDLNTCFTEGWTVAYADLNKYGTYTVEVGDTFEVNGIVYEVEDAETVKVVASTAGAGSAPEQVTYVGVTYDVSIDVSTLSSLVSQAEAITDEAAYTPESWKPFAEAFSAAQKVLTNANATQADVNEAAASLAAALDGLQKMFNDVTNSSEYYYEAVYGMVALGAITGYNATTFGVGDAMTRKDFVTIMWRYCEPEEYKNYNESTSKNTSGLPDVSDGQYWTGAVNWAVEQGVVTGNQLSDGSYVFAPDDSITFEQMITIVARYSVGASKASAWDTTALDTGPFTDATSVSDYARGSMSWAIEKGLVTGNQLSNGLYSLDPLENVARERVVTVLWRGIQTGAITAS